MRNLDQRQMGQVTVQRTGVPDRAYQSTRFFSNYTAVNFSIVWHLQKGYSMCFQTPPAARCTLLMSMTCPFLSFIDQHVCANYVFSNTIGAAPGVTLTIHDKTQSFLVCSAAPPVARCIVLMSMPIAHFSLSNTNTSVLKHLGMSNCAQH